MSNLVRAAEELEFVPKQQLIQMSQDPNASYPSFLVLSEIQRRTQMEKMYAAQQPKPETTVAEELVAEFSGSQGLGAMAQPPGTLNAFQLGGTENMAPPSPIQMMASGGRTGYESGGLTRQQILEANALGIDIVNLSDKEIIEQINLANNARRRNMLLGMTSDLNETFNNMSINQPLPSTEDLLNLSSTTLPAGLQAQIDAAKEPSAFDKFIQGGTQFYFGDPRPDAERPTLARMTDSPFDYLNYIPVIGTASLYARPVIRGIQGAIQGLKGLKGSKVVDDVIDFTDEVPKILPNTGGSNLPKPNIPTTGTNLIPISSSTSLVPTGTGTSLVPSGGGPLAVIGSNFLSRNPRLRKFLFGLGGAAGLTTGYYALQDDEEKVDLDVDTDDKKTPPPEKRSGIDPLDLAKLGGIIMGARNMSELGSGITALAGDIQERRYKEKVLTGQQEQMLYTRLNAISKAIENETDTESERYKQLIQAQNAVVQQINTLYGIEGPDPAKLIESLTVKKSDTPDTESKGISGAIEKTFSVKYPFLSVGSKLLENYLSTRDKKKDKLTPNPNDEGYASTEFLTGDPLIDNIIRIESSGRDVVNSTTGATGPMQVLPSTLDDPGYGIEPAKNNSVEEKIRVGEEYFYAMVDKYNGDVFLGTLAYNLGPGNVDKWLNSGGDINTLKSITSSDGRPIGNDAYNYVVKAYGQDAVDRRLA